MKKNLTILKLEDKTYKRVRNKKKCIYVDINTNDIVNIEENSFVLIKKNDTGKYKKRKVKKVYIANSLEELYKTLGKNKKNIYSNIENINNDDEISKYGLKAIKFKHSIKFFRKAFLAMIIMFVSVFLFLILNNKLKDYKINKLIKNVNSIKNEEVIYLFLEINPKIVLEIKNDKVTDSACLNDDCKTLLEGINIKGKNYKDSIDVIYNRAKDKGYDTSNGVKISTTNINIKEEIENIGYVSYAKINNEEEKSLINEIIDNDELKKQDSRKSYNEELLKIYQKDSDYGKLYTCSIEDGELGCYISDKLYNEYVENTDTLLGLISSVLTIEPKIMSVCDKFQVKYTTTGVEGAELIGIDKMVIGKIEVDGAYRAFSYFSINSFEIRGAFNLESYDIGMAGMDNLSIRFLPLNKLNLIDGSYKEKDVITYKFE